MMNVLEYAEDIGKTSEEVLRICRYLKMDYIKDKGDILNEDDIIELDSYFQNEETEEVEEDSEVETKEPVKTKPKKEVSKKEVSRKEKTEEKEVKLDKKDLYKNKEKLMSNKDASSSVVVFKEGITLKEFASAMDVPVNELIKKLFSLGIVSTVNSHINMETAEVLASEYEKEIKTEESMDVANFETFEIIDNDENLEKRPPVVTIMGHVDHGKTTLLDTIRKSDAASLEVGGITQTITAYQVDVKGEKITFIDTPGHAAFTEMRSRGSKITDVIIIIVAADDGLMPQTKEAIDHAKAAGVPIIVAINKIDKETANVDKVMTELSDYGLVPDAWGGDTLYCNISALNNIGIEELLENILMIAELEEYKANPNRYAIGTVIESRVCKKTGNTATLLVQTGTLRVGDPVVVGTAYGKIRTIKNEYNVSQKEALPSQPITVTGLNDLPIAGDKFMAFETEKEAKSVWNDRKTRCQNDNCIPQNTVTLEEMFDKIKDGTKEICVLIKADLNGSAEALKSVVEKIEVDGVRIKIVRSSVGGITESDVILAKASGAIMVAFNVRPNEQIRKLAEESNVEIRFYNIIYKVVEDLEHAMKGMLEPEYEEKILGQAEVRTLFKFSKVGTIAGSYVKSGIIKNNSKCRIIRNEIVVFEGTISSIQREKNQAKEVKNGLECGITIEDYNDIKEGDIIESFELVEVKR